MSRHLGSTGTSGLWCTTCSPWVASFALAVSNPMMGGICQLVGSHRPGHAPRVGSVSLPMPAAAFKASASSTAAHEEFCVFFARHSIGLSWGLVWSIGICSSNSTSAVLFILKRLNSAETAQGQKGKGGRRRLVLVAGQSGREGRCPAAWDGARLPSRCSAGVVSAALQPRQAAGSTEPPGRLWPASPAVAADGSQVCAARRANRTVPSCRAAPRPLPLAQRLSQWGGGAGRGSRESGGAGGTMLRAAAAQRLRRAVSAGGGGGRGGERAPLSPGAGAPPRRPARGAEGSAALLPRPAGPVPSGAEVTRGRAPPSARPVAVAEGRTPSVAGAELLLRPPLLSRTVAVKNKVSEWTPGVFKSPL